MPDQGVEGMVAGLLRATAFLVPLPMEPADDLRAGMATFSMTAAPRPAPALSMWKGFLLLLVCGGLAGVVVFSNVGTLTAGYPIKSPQPLVPHLLAAPITVVILTAVFRCLVLGAAGRWRFWLASTKVHERAFGAALFVLLFLVYAVVIASQAPGWFTEDVVYTFHMVRAGWWTGWYSPLHPLLYSVLLQMVPSSWFVTLCNAGLAAFVLASYGREMVLLGASRLAAATFVVAIAFLPPTLVMVLAPVRDSFFASGFLLFCLMVFRAFRGADSGGWALARVLLVGGLLSAYRSDVLPAVVLSYAALAFAPGVRARARLFAVASAASLVTILLVTAAIPAILQLAWDDRAEREYKLTLIAHPLTYFVREGQYYSRSDANWSAIEAVFPHENLKKYWNPYNIAVFYQRGWNEAATAAERDAAFQAAVRLFTDNPGLYLSSKFKLFMRSSGLQDNETFPYIPTPALAGGPVDVPGIPDSLQPLGQQIRSMLHASQEFHGLSVRGRMLWWNVIVPNILLLVVVLRWSRSSGLALMASVLLLRELVVAVLAPATFVHYYFPIFVGGYLVAALAISARPRTQQPRRPEPAQA